jgi:hypothetical protein
MLSIRREFDLHVEVVKFMREMYPEAVLVPGLGEYQDSDEMRIKSWQKGYTSGQPDLLILHPFENFVGMAIEFKHPSGKSTTTENQDAFALRLRNAGFKTMVSHSYPKIIMELVHCYGKPTNAS